MYLVQISPCTPTWFLTILKVDKPRKKLAQGWKSPQHLINQAVYPTGTKTGGVAGLPSYISTLLGHLWSPSRNRLLEKCFDRLLLHLGSILDRFYFELLECSVKFWGTVWIDWENISGHHFWLSILCWLHIQHTDSWWVFFIEYIRFIFTLINALYMN